MQAFKVFFKVIRRNLTSILIYIAVFLILAVASTFFGNPQRMVNFEGTKSPIVIINEDSASPFTRGLADYLSENARIVTIKTDKQSLQDALFFREVEYILRIPNGFAEGFLAGDTDALLEKTTVPDSFASVQLDFMVTRYLNLAATYTKALPDVTQPELVQDIRKDLSQGAEITLTVPEAAAADSNAYNYFIYLAYSLMAVMVLGVTTIMMVFNKLDLKRRNLASPMKSLSLNLQLVLGNVVYSLIVWGVLGVVAYLLFPQAMNISNAPLLLANALVYTLVCLSISFFIGNLIKSRGAQQAVANVLSLGLCFISGVFVPQELLGKTVMSLASFTPTYWYVKNIINLKSASGLLPVTYGILIQLGFAVAFLILSLVVAKQKSVSNG